VSKQIELGYLLLFKITRQLYHNQVNNNNNNMQNIKNGILCIREL